MHAPREGRARHTHHHALHHALKRDCEVFRNKRNHFSSASVNIRRHCCCESLWACNRVFAGRTWAAKHGDHCRTLQVHPLDVRPGGRTGLDGGMAFHRKKPIHGTFGTRAAGVSRQGTRDTVAAVPAPRDTMVLRVFRQVFVLCAAAPQVRHTRRNQPCGRRCP